MKHSIPRRLLFSLLACASLHFAVTVAADQNHFNVRNYGAVGDGKNLDSPAINKAIDAAVAVGGGTVVVPAGTYLSGSIRLKSNIHLLLDAGAVILGDKWDSVAYDPTEPYTLGGYQDGGHSFFHNSLIWGENLTNVSITGQGMINGGGLTTWEGKLDEKIGFGLNPPFPTDHGGPVQAANKAIALKLCKNVLIRDVTIFHGGWFAILVTGCDNVTIDNVTIDTNRDGMDIDCCRNVMVSNCRVNSPNDDGICPKSTHVLGYPRITENLTIVNCQVSGFEEGTLLDGTMKPTKGYATGRIKFGTESSGGFRNVTIANCTFRSSHGLALEEVDGGILENFTINNLTMMDVKCYAIYLTTGKRNRTPNLTTPSRMRNILISNVIADGVDKMSGIQIMGLPEQPIENVRLENIRLTSRGGGTTNDAAIQPPELGTGYPEPGMMGTLPAYGIFARHVRGLDLANIHLNFETKDMRPAAAFTDIDGLEIDNLKPQVAESVRAAVFAADVRGVTIRNSPGVEPPALAVLRPTQATAVASPTVPPQPATVAPAGTAIRIAAGSRTGFTDDAGNVWLSDRGFEGGESAEREADLKIENTKSAGLYRTERWGMSSFSQLLPNGKYVVKLHFAETYEGITGPGERVFSFNVEGREFRDFDVWLKAGGPRRAYVETVNVDITDGKLDITFEGDVDQPEINGIEIIPAL